MGTMTPAVLKKIYNKLEKFYGDLGWWPGGSDFEIMVGAILTQNTAWTNVEKAVNGLRGEDVMSPESIISMKRAKLEELIRPSGFFKQKAKRLKIFSAFLIAECNGNIRTLSREDKDILREKLLSIKGIGPETADSMLLYALRKPVFVVDAYTKRIFSRHSLIAEGVGYDELQGLLHDNFSMDMEKLNRYHSYIVETGKRFCKKRKPQCEGCPLRGISGKR